MPNFPVHLQTHPNATPFLHKIRPQLEAKEARNGLMLGLALRVETEPNFYGSTPYFATVDDAVDDTVGIVAAALMTPPHGLILYCDRESYWESSGESLGDPQADASVVTALQAIAYNLQTNGWAVPTAHGPSAVVARFAEIWSTLTGASYELTMAQRAFELHEVSHPHYSPGHLRLVTEADIELAVQWVRAFGHEALPNETQDNERLREQVTQKIAYGQLFFWDNGQPVCLAGVTRPTVRGIAIGPVYTPSDQRGHGYATSAVAQLSQKMLDAGKEFCALFTDLANPTSNHIYEQIGYRAVGDFRVYRFTQ